MSQASAPVRVRALRGGRPWQRIDSTCSVIELSAIASSRHGRAITRKPRARSRILKNVWPAPSASNFVEYAVIGLLQRIRPRAQAPAKMEIRASRSS